MKNITKAATIAIAVFLSIILQNCATFKRFEFTLDDVTKIRIVESPELSKAKIYEKAKQWIAEIWVRPDRVTRYDNMDEGLIKIEDSDHIIEVEIKEGRSRIKVVPRESLITSKFSWQEWKKDMYFKEADELLTTFEKKIQSQGAKW